MGVPTPLVVGGTIYSNGFFCSDNQRNVSGIIKKLASAELGIKNIFLNFPRNYRGLNFCVNTGNLA